jgi:hypothetical protein
VSPLAFALAAALASPAVAQDPAEDWDLTVRPELNLTVATLDFGDNVLALRCQSGALDLLITGVPASLGTTRTVTVSAGAVADEDQVWAAQAGQPLLAADEPARLARQLRPGGDLDLRIHPEVETDSPRRYRLPAPASAASVDAVLTACGQPLTEPRDLLRRASGPPPVWSVQPLARYPEAAASGGARDGMVRLSCVVGPDWKPTDCRAESESPAGLGFAASAIDAAERAVTALPADGSDVRGQLIRFTVRFRLGG